MLLSYVFILMRNSFQKLTNVILTYFPLENVNEWSSKLWNATSVALLLSNLIRSWLHAFQTSCSNSVNGATSYISIRYSIIFTLATKRKHWSETVSKPSISCAKESLFGTWQTLWTSHQLGNLWWSWQIGVAPLSFSRSCKWWKSFWIPHSWSLWPPTINHAWQSSRFYWTCTVILILVVSFDEDGETERCFNKTMILIISLKI